MSALLLFFANDKDLFLSEDLPLQSDKNKRKDFICLQELVADDIIEMLEFLPFSSIKKSIKRIQKRCIIYITAVTSRLQ